MRTPKPRRETIELIDHTVYFSDDNWATVWHERGLGRSHRKVLDKAEADRVRFLAIMQTTSHAGRS
jgi:hypothetical protein